MVVTWDDLGSSILGSSQNFWLGFGSTQYAAGQKVGNIGINLFSSVNGLITDNRDIFGWAVIGISVATVGLIAWKLGGRFS